MTQLFTRNQMKYALSNPTTSTDVGLGLYRQGYREFGIEYWGIDAASEVKYFLDHIVDRESLPELTMLDIAAGTGKNVLEFARLSVKHAHAVEIDSIGTLHLLKALVSLEEAKLLPENRVTVVKDDAIHFLQHHTAQYDIVVCYGLLHVFKDPDYLKNAISLIKKSVVAGGYLILQAITDKYPAPAIQPELEGVIVNAQTFSDNFQSPKWLTIHVDDKDISHSHSGSEEHHKHGSIRIILQKSYET